MEKIRENKAYLTSPELINSPEQNNIKENLAETPVLNRKLEDKDIKKEMMENLQNEINSHFKDEEKPEDEEIIEIKKEFFDEIISKENRRYKSNEALLRAQKIDKDFPSTKIGKIFNKYKSQEKNLDYVNPNPKITIADWLEEGEGGHYIQQPQLVSRKKDFINITNKTNPTQAGQILEHEYNHMLTQGESNFSEKYKTYIRNIFLSDKEIKSLKGQSEYEMLFREPYKGAPLIYKYLTSPAEVNAYLGTNFRNDLVNNGVIENFYDKIDEQMIELSPQLKNSNCNKENTPIYKIYLSIIKDKKKLLNWLNNYAI